MYCRQRILNFVYVIQEFVSKSRVECICWERKCNLANRDTQRRAPNKHNLTQWPRCLRHELSSSLERWDRGFESHSRHGCLCAFILCLCCSSCR
jgi:hypothetical protein